MRAEFFAQDFVGADPGQLVREVEGAFAAAGDPHGTTAAYRHLVKTLVKRLGANPNTLAVKTAEKRQVRGGFGRERERGRARARKRVVFVSMHQSTHRHYTLRAAQAGNAITHLWLFRWYTPRSSARWTTRGSKWRRSKTPSRTSRRSLASGGSTSG